MYHDALPPSDHPGAPSDTPREEHPVDDRLPETPPVDEQRDTVDVPEPPKPREEPPSVIQLPAHEEATVRAEDEEEAPSIELPDALPILPLKDTVIYPMAMMPLGVGKDRSIRLIDEVMRGSRLVGLVAQKDAEVEDAGPDDCYRVGTVARIARLLRIPDGTMQIIVQGLERIAIEEFVETQPFLRARCHIAPESAQHDIEVEALKRNAIDMFQRLVNLVQYLPDQLALAAMNMDDPRQVVYLIASTAQMELPLRQELIELDSVRKKLEKVTAFLTHDLEVLELGKKIQNQAQEEMGKAQREYFLREQLKAIQRELGEE